jgi:hypothetical protein
MQLLVRGYCTMVAAPVQRYVDGIPKWSHHVRQSPMVQHRRLCADYELQFPPPFATKAGLNQICVTKMRQIPETYSVVFPSNFSLSASASARLWWMTPSR